jgi:hypothetical protein
MSFDHQYVETVTVTGEDALNNGVEAHRFIKRNGAYPAEGGFAAGVNVYRIYGQGQLTDKGYQVNNPETLVYEGQLNPSTTPLNPSVFPYQGLASLVTAGIVIVEAAGEFGVDDAVAASADGRAIPAAGGQIVLGRALDVIEGEGPEAAQYIRVRLDNEGLAPSLA